MDHLYCYIFVPTDVSESATAYDLVQGTSNDHRLQHLKVKEIKEYMYEVYAE